MLWNVDAGLAQMHKYLKINDKHVIAGALLGVGILNCGVKHDMDPVRCLTIVCLKHYMAVMIVFILLKIFLCSGI